MPGKKPWLQARLRERKYFDSGDYALSRAGKADKLEVGREIATPQALGAGTVETCDFGANNTDSPVLGAAAEPESVVLDSDYTLRNQEDDKDTNFDDRCSTSSSSSESSSPASSEKHLATASLAPGLTRPATLPGLGAHVWTPSGSSQPPPLMRTNSLASPILVPSNNKIMPGNQPIDRPASGMRDPLPSLGAHPERPLARVSTIPIHHADTPHGRSSVSGSFSSLPPSTFSHSPGSSIASPQIHLRPRSASHLSRESFSASDAARAAAASHD